MWSTDPPPLKVWKKRNGTDILEKDVEKDGKKKFDALGWSFEKYSSPQKRSVPDRLCGAPATGIWWPYGLIFFIEYKRPGKVATESQQIDHKKRRDMGHLVFVVDCYAQTDVVIEMVTYMLETGEVLDLPPWLTR